MGSPLPEEAEGVRRQAHTAKLFEARLLVQSSHAGVPKVNELRPGDRHRRPLHLKRESRRKGIDGANGSQGESKWSVFGVIRFSHTYNPAG